MNKQQLIKKIAKDSHRTDASAAIALQIVIDAISDSLASGEDITIRGFGMFKAARRAQREGRNPKTGEPITIPAATVPRFVAGKGLKEAVK